MRFPVLSFLVLSTGCIFSDLVLNEDSIACEGTEQCPSGFRCHVLQNTCVQGEVGLPCSVDLDCPFGAVCFQGSCETGCQEDGDCGLHHACVDGRCETDAAVCSDDALCDLGEVCGANGRCTKPPQFASACRSCRTDRPCYRDRDCPGDETCEGFRLVREGEQRLLTFGRCTCGGGACSYDAAPLGQCTSDSGCAEGFYCERRPCFEGTSCDPGACSGAVVLPGFRSGSLSWPPIRRCSLGTCVKASCQSSANCEPLGADCPKGFTCFNIVDAQDCTQDAQCSAGQSCGRFNEVGERGCTCQNDGHCAEGRVCSNGFCLRNIRNQCLPAFGLVCEDFR